MARPRKTGIDYFPFDVDFFEDEKIIAVGGEFGAKGETVAIKLLCAIYRNGYFAEWSDMLCYKLLRQSPGIAKGLIEEIVRCLVRRGFFDKSLFDSASILTSAGIQRRYFEIAKFRTLDPCLPYLLVEPKGYAKAPDGVSQEKTQVSQEKTPVSQEKTPQIKVNKIKVNKIKENQGESRACARESSPGPAPSGSEKLSFCPPGEEELGEAVRRPDMQRWSPTLNDAREFRDYYDARGWLMNGQPMRDWLAAFRSWLSKKKRYGGGASSTVVAAPPQAQQQPRQPETPYTPPSPEFLEQLNKTAPWNRQGDSRTEQK